MALAVAPGLLALSGALFIRITSATLLLTPVDPVLRVVFWLVGAALGWVAAGSLFRHASRRPATPDGKRQSLWIALAAIAGALFGIMALDLISRKISEYRLFGNTKGIITLKLVPITSISQPKGGYRGGVVLYGREVWVDITQRDYVALNNRRLPGLAASYCLNLRIETLDGAARLWLPNISQRSKNASTIVRC